MPSLLEQLRQKRLFRQFLIFFFAVIVFHSVIYYPVYLFLASDIAWKSSIVFFLWAEIAEPLSVYLFFWGSFAYVIYAGIRYSVRAAIPYLVVYSIGSVLRYALQNVCFILMMGFPSWQRSFSPLEILWNVLLDLLIMGCVYGLLLLHRPRMESAGKTAFENCFPIDGFFDLKSMLVRLSLLSAAIPSIARLVTRAYYDVRTIVFEGLAPSGAPEIFLMVTYYVTDILTALLGHLLILTMLSSFHISDVRAQMRFDGEERKG